MTQDPDQDEKDFHQQIIDLLVKVVHVYDDQYIVWFFFDGGKNIQLPTQDEINKAIEQTQEMKCAKLIGSAHNDDGRAVESKIELISHTPYIFINGKGGIVKWFSRPEPKRSLHYLTQPRNEKGFCK